MVPPILSSSWDLNYNQCWYGRHFHGLKEEEEDGEEEISLKHHKLEETISKRNEYSVLATARVLEDSLRVGVMYEEE